MRIKFVILVIAFLFLNATYSFACSCVGPENAKEGLVRAKAVFSGQIISASTNNKDFTFKVDRIWKGESKAEIVVRDYMARTSCAFNFKVGEKYIVFATTIEDDDGKTILIGDVCNWTTKLSWEGVNDILRQIGAGKSLTAKPMVKKRPKVKTPGKKRSSFSLTQSPTSYWTRGA